MACCLHHLQETFLRFNFHEFDGHANAHQISAETSKKNESAPSSSFLNGRGTAIDHLE